MLHLNTKAAGEVLLGDREANLIIPSRWEFSAFHGKSYKSEERRAYALVVTRSLYSGHKCMVKQAFLIEPTKSGDEEVQKEQAGINNAEIFVHAMVGVHGPRTMRLTAWVK